MFKTIGPRIKDVRHHILSWQTAHDWFGAEDRIYWWEPGRYDTGRGQYLEYLIEKFKKEKINWRLV